MMVVKCKKMDYRIEWKSEIMSLANNFIVYDFLRQEINKDIFLMSIIVNFK